MSPRPPGRWPSLPERPLDGRLLAGVCAALAERYVVEVTLVRLAFLVLALASGFGVVVYLLMWLSLPAEGSEGRDWREVARANLDGMLGEVRHTGHLASTAWSSSGASRWPRPLGRRWIALLLVGGGALVLLWSLDLFWWLGLTRSIALAAIAIGVSILAVHASEGRR